ncbi:MAG: phosphopyruvate hydratase [bacterium]|nr:phosphopyruvate hydratase [bacterium]
MTERIAAIAAREILDSRGNPTVAVTVALDTGVTGCSAVPAGASRGEHEARERRDGGKRFGGLGVRRAVANVTETIAPALCGLPAADQAALDARLLALDASPNKAKLGANAMLGVSLAAARAAANAARLPLYRYLRQSLFPSATGWPLPTPMANILNGGVHAGWSVDFQEFMVLPQQRSSVEQVRCGAEIFHALGRLLARRKLPVTVGDEGGYAPRLPGNEAPLKLMASAVRAAGYRLGRDVRFGLDPAASEFYRGGMYQLRSEQRSLSSDAMIRRYRAWVKKYPIATIEDGLAEDDWSGWQRLTVALGKTVTLVGDDLFVTNTARLQRGIDQGVANAILIKPNQVGTLTETVAAMRLARRHGYGVAVSHRSGETTDTFIVDLAVAGQAEYLKAGSFSRGERVAKWNRLMVIAEQVAD